MSKRKVDHNASTPKSEKEGGTHNNGADGDGIKKDNENGDAKVVERTFDFCAYYRCGDDDDDDRENAIRATGDGDFVVDYEKGQQGLARYICSSGLPDIVRLVKNLNPSFPLDSSTIRHNCLQVYEKEKLRVKHILKTMDGQISLSVEVLRFYRRITGNDSELMCLAAHFIDDRWKQKRWVLGFRRIFCGGEILHTAALKTLKDWDIESKVSSLTLAESDLYDEMVEEFKDGVQQKKKLPLDGKLFRVQCCAEMFNQMADSAYKEISDIIDKVSLLISWKFAPVWYLTAYKLKEALEMDAMGEFSSEMVSDFYDIPSADEWEKVKCICKLVASAEAVAKSIFRKKHPTPTANVFLHNLEELRVTLFKETMSSDSFTGKVAKEMLRILDKYLENMFSLLSIASVMDPRQKMRYVDYLSSKREISDTKSQSTSLLDALHGIYSGYVDHDLEKEKSAGDSTSSDSEEELTSSPEGEGSGNLELKSSPEGGSSRNLKWLEEYNQFIESNNKPPKSDLDRYLEEPVLPWTTDFNVLKWWRAESPKYPILSKMARDILAIPMSVPNSDNAFHTEQREVQTRMMVCGPSLRDALMCTQTWDVQN